MTAPGASRDSGRVDIVARCRDGTSRAGFAALDTWLERQAEPVSLVTMESSGHYWMPLCLRRDRGPGRVGGLSRRGAPVPDWPEVPAPSFELAGLAGIVVDAPSRREFTNPRLAPTRA